MPKVPALKEAMCVLASELSVFSSLCPLALVSLPATVPPPGDQNSALRSPCSASWGVSAAFSWRL